MKNVKSPARHSQAAPAKGGQNYQAPALDKGLEILEFLARHGEPHGLADLAKALNREKNTLYRMALVLERRGYIERTADDRFFLSNRLFKLGMQTPPIRNLHDAALPVMHELSQRLAQSCHLAVRTDDDIVIVARVESPGLLGFAVRIGYRRHVTDSASGSILFGFAPDSIRSDWLKSLRRTASKTMDVDRFMTTSAEARARGYAMVPSSNVSAITDIAAPVFDGGEPGPIAALTIPFLTQREEPAHAAQAANSLVEAADRITQQLTHG
jgi:DNA-binding IclR family transcriptional regulator